MSSLAGVLANSPLGGDPLATVAKPSFDTLIGADIAPLRNPANGKFDLQWDATGNVLFDDTQEHAVLSVLLENKQQYWADPTGLRGSFLFTVKEDRKITPSALQGFAQDALQYLVDNRKIFPPQGQAQILVTATRVKPGRIDLGITYTTAQGLTITTRPSLKY